MSERVSAIPSRLIRYATESNGIADDLRVAAGALDDAVDHLRVRRTDLASAVPDLGALLLRLAMQARAIGEFAHTIGAAFAEAGGADAHGVVQADACAVDIAAARGWRPRRALAAMTNAAWWRAVWRDRCDGGTSFYGGAGSAIRGPDGRLYPLVAPSIMRDGRVYNADWGREGQPRVGDLFGADPGWHVVDVETGVERHRDAPSLFERLMIGVGATVAGPPLASSEADVELVVLEPGRRPRVEKSASHVRGSTTARSRRRRPTCRRSRRHRHSSPRPPRPSRSRRPRSTRRWAP